MGSLFTIVGKDLRLMVRDRTALAFIVVAPIIVICVAGLSLASLYGAEPNGQRGYDIPLVDEDDGQIAARIEELLVGDDSIRIRQVSSREEAQRLVEQKVAGTAVVIPAGTEATLASGRSAPLLLYTDPVKYLERVNVRLRILEATEELTRRERARIVERLGQQRDRMVQQIEAINAALTTMGTTIAATRRQAGETQTQIARELNVEVERLREAVTAQIERFTDTLRVSIDEAIGAAYQPLQQSALDYLDSLEQSRRAFEAWFAELQRLANRRADDIPTPPSFPEPPAELLRALEVPPEPTELPPVPRVAVDLRLPEALAGNQATPLGTDLPTLEVPETPSIAAPLTIEEITVGEAATTINTFDQNVPGFSVTFLLLGMLLGVSLGLLDERDWGTFDRIRSLPVPARNILIGKLLSRFLVGIAQMIALFAVGYLLFDISLGPQPWALALPISGIVFAGTAFGLIIAALAPSRDAVLPLGSIAIVTMAAIGGCWWPIDLEPRWMRTLALGFPTTWAMDAFNDLMIRGRRADAALGPFAVLLAYGLVYLLLGLLLFRRRIARS